MLAGAVGSKQSKALHVPRYCHAPSLPHQATTAGHIQYPARHFAWQLPWEVWPQPVKSNPVFDGLPQDTLHCEEVFVTGFTLLPNWPPTLPATLYLQTAMYG